ncbi:MAG: hypothetical protein FWB95_01675 [Treponema sp.]|nr:hypothetical protein [Treponema sp.]
MINVETEVNKFKNCKDRDEIVRQIREYKNLALQSSSDIFLAGQYDMVAHRLQEICDKLPAPRLKKIPTGAPAAKTKTANITKAEKVKIENAWSQKAGFKGKK